MPIVHPFVLGLLRCTGGDIDFEHQDLSTSYTQTTERKALLI